MTFRTGVADRVHGFLDCGKGLLRGGSPERLMAGNLAGVFQRVRVGPIFHMAVLVAFPDSVSFQQDA
ncbi:MAG: hypothetical protein QOJ84_3119 [Bradyrhizobium sp.]|jgi:hypothetical protein|nr:hypothetical protein [Bradyrhizobium sp.]